MPGEIFNANPTVYAPSKPYSRKTELRSLWIGDTQDEDDDSDEVEVIDQDEIFGAYISTSLTLVMNRKCHQHNLDLIRSIYDPEHPNTLEELRVVSAPQIKVGENHVLVEFTPTVPHCGMSTLIGEFSPTNTAFS